MIPILLIIEQRFTWTGTGWELHTTVTQMNLFQRNNNGIFGISKAYQRINLLFRSFVSGNVCILTRAYITFIRPLLEYCSFIWSPYQICYIEKIEGIQRYFTRRVLKHVGLPYMERLSVLKLESLEVRRIRADLKLCFKIIYGLCDLDTSDFFTFVSLLICNQRS